MILRRIEVQRFRVLDDFGADFAPGLNVVRGPNEAGKSTLQAAIVALLFEKAAASPTALDAMRSWRGDTAPVLRGEFTDNGDSFSLLKDFEAREGVLVLPDGSRIADAKKLAARVAEIIGVDSQELYQATACLRQQQWAQVVAGQALRESLQQNLTGGAEGRQVQAILKDLDKAIKNLERGRRSPALNPGPMKQLQDEIARTAADLDVALQECDKARKARLELESAGARAERTQAELEEAQALSRRVAQALDIERKAGEIRKQADGLEQRMGRIRDLESDIEALERGLAEKPNVDEALAAEVSSWATRMREREEELERDRSDLSGMESNRLRLESELQRVPAHPGAQEQIDRARKLRAELDHTHAEASDNAREAAECARAISEGQRQIAPRRVMAVAGALITVAGIALATVSPAYLAAAVLGLVLAAIGLFLRPAEGWRELPERMAGYKAAQDAATQRAADLEQELSQLMARAGGQDLDALAREIEEAERLRISLEAGLESERSSIAVLGERIDEREAVVRNLREKLHEALRASGLESVEILVEEAQARGKALRLLTGRRDQLQGALGGQTVEELARQQRELAIELRGLTEELATPELATARLSPTEYQALQTRIEHLLAERDAGDAARRQAEALLEAARHDQDSVAELEGRLARLQGRAGMLEERLAVYTLARDVVDEATREVMSSVTESIAPRMGELLAGLTRQRYSSIELDSEMGPVVTCPRDQRQIGLGPGRRTQDSSLSCATREQVFLAARLALVDMLWPKGGPPLLLDDPLVNFDPERRLAAVDAIRSASETHQIIVFTCGSDLDPAAAMVVEMPGPPV